jgi:hypothetical protein
MSIENAFKQKIKIKKPLVAFKKGPVTLAVKRNSKPRIALAQSKKVGIGKMKSMEDAFQ